MKNSFLLLLLTNSILFAQLPKTIYKTINGQQVYTIETKNVFFITSKFNIDADGAPKAYNKVDNIALDYLANAGKPGNWWALVTDNNKKSGKPITQTKNDPAPGFFVSTTSLGDNTKNYKDPNRYVNSETIPYIVLPAKLSKDFKLGDIALVVNKKNNKRCFAIFADIGEIGEGSIYLAKQLEINSNPKNGGTEAKEIVYILLKNSGKGKVLTIQEIEEIGKTKLTDKDIVEMLK